MPASAEFIALCRSQVNLLTQGLGASLSAVYLTDEMTEDAGAKLIPIVVYPEETAWSEPVPLSLPMLKHSYLLAEANSAFALPPNALTNALAGSDDQNDQAAAKAAKRTNPMSLVRQQRVVLPLIHEDLVLGLLVVGREDRRWSEGEQAQLEQVAHVLSLACVLDQRYQWLADSEFHQHALQAQQHETLANLLHQFRNPLTTLRTLGKLLLKRLQPEDRNRRVASSIVQESDHLQALLQQFETAIDPEVFALDQASGFDRQLNRPPALLGPESDAQSPVPLLSPSSLSLETLQLEPCSISFILESLLSSAIAIADEKNLRLRTELVPNLPPVQANQQALREVLTNLIDNALKYTPAGGQVLIQVNQQTERFPSHQVVAISNSGPGIPPQDLEHLFERHYRGIQADGDLPGTGLGLAIARELMHQMQGEIQVFSPAQAIDRRRALNFPGAGVTFMVLLPAPQPQ